MTQQFRIRSKTLPDCDYLFRVHTYPNGSRGGTIWAYNHDREDFFDMCQGATGRQYLRGDYMDITELRKEWKCLRESGWQEIPVEVK